MNKQQVITLMQSSDSIPKWNSNEQLCKEQSPTFSDYWYKDIVMSGIMWDTLINRKYK